MKLERGSNSGGGLGRRLRKAYRHLKEWSIDFIKIGIQWNF